MWNEPKAWRICKHKWQKYQWSIRGETKKKHWMYKRLEKKTCTSKSLYVNRWTDFLSASNNDRIKSTSTKTFALISLMKGKWALILFTSLPLIQVLERIITNQFLWRKDWKVEVLNDHLVAAKFYLPQSFWTLSFLFFPSFTMV